MNYKLCAVVWAFLLAFNCGCWSLAMPQNDIDRPFDTPVDYNTVVGHFKDFFMYLPVMMTTLKETMSGFPKFAEGIRILTSKTGRLNDDCKCRGGSPDNGGSSNEIDNGRYGR